MSALPDPHRDGLALAARIAERSRLAAIATALVGGVAAAVASSRVVASARRRANRFRGLPPAERTRCLLIAAAAALGGHGVMAKLLPASAAPTLSLTALALIGVGLAVAVSAQRRAGEEEILQPDHVARRPG